MTTKKYPLGIQTFSEIKRGNYLYADKTAYVYKLAHYAKYHFLSRPRRFGKSLFVTTLQAYFEGRKELFEGLEIMQLEQEWTAYPVIHIDLSMGKYFRLKNLHAVLDAVLQGYEKQYGLSVDEDMADVYSVRVKNLIDAAYSQTGKQVVVLIDEYDAPMHDAMGNELLQKEIKEVTRDFMSPLKLQEAKLRFVFITGISKFSQLSIFSELNNLKILTMKDEYANVCGITETELIQYFGDGIKDMAESNGMTQEEAVEELKRQYDGYHFSAKGEGVYNPYSIINALDDKRFNSYWFSSATPTFLIELLQQKGMDMLQLEDIWASESRFDVPTEKLTDPIPVLYQSGYLTIKSYDARRRMYHLGFPNEEVRRGFSDSLYHYYAPSDAGERDQLAVAYTDTLMGATENMEVFMPHLKAFYNKFPYTLVNNNERHYQAVLYTIFTMLGADVVAEHITSNGRIDLLLRTQKSIYIFELKYAKTTDVAMQQMISKQYAQAFADDRREKYLIAINFSANDRTIDDWDIKHLR